ncbi:hypothetical protein PUN28_004824 [Cardiocondyla obscurior]|uniref:Uncharacterized protein n=1 Tax=Cardiocondyla obscurior TaxID=286306 RepID=A0AAW2GHW2_9HYME
MLLTSARECKNAKYGKKFQTCTYAHTCAISFSKVSDEPAHAFRRTVYVRAVRQASSRDRFPPLIPPVLLRFVHRIRLCARHRQINSRKARLSIEEPPN